jgi:DUF1680 family protein
MATDLTPYRVAPACEPVPADSRFALRGVVGDWLETVVDNWLLPFPRANPAITQMFRDRDRRPTRRLMPWSGEFAGKYLLGALHLWELTGDERLRETIEAMVEELLAAQGADGYLGPFPAETRLTGNNWDLWGHYHTIFALLRHHALTGEGRSLEAAVCAADLLCATFGPGRARILHEQQMNMGLVHGLALLYRYVPKPEYLETARWIVEDSDIPGGVQFLRAARRGKEFYQFDQSANRWEILHFTQGLAELYWLTGETECRDAFTRVWDSIRRLDRHNTGGFSTGERAVGTPYRLPGEDTPERPTIWQACIETCCTVAWNALSVDMLRLTGDSTVADEIELTLYNSAQGSMHPSGRWWTYNTPMRGWRLSSADQIQFQAHPGGPELNCCNANAPRPLGLVRDWALTTGPDGLALNHYGAGTITVPLPGGGEVTLEQETEYPLEGAVLLRVTPDQPREFALRLRIPAWSRETKVAVNGEPVSAQAGTYLSLRRRWQSGDQVRIDLDFSPRYWAGREDCAGMIALYRGPLLLAWDQRFSDCEEGELPALDASSLCLERLGYRGPGPQPLLLAEARDGQGRAVVLCDFAGAGAAGNPYTSWLPANDADPGCEGPFTRGG